MQSSAQRLICWLNPLENMKVLFYYVKANTKPYARYTIFGVLGIDKGAQHFPDLESAIVAAAKMQRFGKWHKVKVHIERR